MSNYIGIDTSNYTTSTALYDGEKMKHVKKLLPVKKGELGLRQSDAVFHHVQQLGALLNEILPCENVKAIGVSAFPRRQEGSYMPCFTVGKMTAGVLARAYNAELFEFSHQEGHIASALYSASRLDLIGKKFIAFHVSGGTTEAVLVNPVADNPLNCILVSKTLDLNAGQAIDRIGLMMNLSFPCGRELERLALSYNGKINAKPTLKDENMCLSGLENICKRMLDTGKTKEETAAFCIEYILKSINSVTKRLILKYGELPLIYAGGVMSNSIIKKYISEKHGGIFAEPEFSTDNAAGIALLASLKAEGSFV